MEMNMNRWNQGNQGNQFENPSVEPYDDVLGAVSLDEISRQLFAQGVKGGGYEKVIGELRAGNLVGIDYAKNLKKTLASFSSILHKESKATAEGKRLSDIIEERIRTLDGLLKTANISH